MATYKEKTKLFPTGLPMFFPINKLIHLINIQTMHGWFLLWPAILNFDSFGICLNNLHPPIHYIYEKAYVKWNEKGILVQILTLVDTTL